MLETHDLHAATNKQPFVSSLLKVAQGCQWQRWGAIGAVVRRIALKTYVVEQIQRNVSPNKSQPASKTLTRQATEN